MSAKLTYNQKGNAMVFLGNNEKPWWWGADTSSRGKEDHGYLYPDQRTAKEALGIICDGESFSYSEVLPMYQGEPVDGYKYVVNSMKRKVISIVGDKYHVQQPSDFAGVIDRIFTNGFVVDTFGALDEGRLLFCTAKVKAECFSDKKESEMIRMLTFIGSCDYTCPFKIVSSSLRTVCWNTFTPQLKANCQYSARHTVGMNSNIEFIMEKIKVLNRYWENLDLLMRGLEEEPIRQEDYASFAKELFDLAGDGKKSTRAMNKARDVFKLSLAEGRKYGHNRLALLNGVTEFTSHPERRAHGNIRLKESVLSQEIRLRIGEKDDLVNKAVGILTKDSLELAELIK